MTTWNDPPECDDTDLDALIHGERLSDPIARRIDATSPRDGRDQFSRRFLFESIDLR